MQSPKGIDYKSLRKKVSVLFYSVLNKKISVNDALIKFPMDCEDKTITAAWHALCHFEADEEIRLKDSLYAQEQNKYLEYIAETLNNGNALPKNIINAYIPYHNEALIPNGSNLKGIIHKLKKFLCC
ncbi:MAG: hypothetical protein LUG16_02970 [Candidatus Gastranaerophilales bacterium]|nr:hypothetical protein [Candidatus Gastranaerophilales bacterium]